MCLTDKERLEFKKKAQNGVTYVRALPRHRKITQERILKIFKENRTTAADIQTGRLGQGGNANVKKGDAFAQKQKNKEKDFGGNTDTNVGDYRITEPYKKCNVCGYGFDKRKCETKHCTCCACCDPYANLGACCEYYNNYTEHNVPTKDEE